MGPQSGQGLGMAQSFISTSVRSLALQGVFRDFKLQAGETLHIEELRVEWGRTGLRQSDLLLALQELSVIGQVVVLGDDMGEEEVALTDNGELRCGRLASGALVSARDLAALATLLRVGRRRRSVQPAKGRRCEDRLNTPAQSQALH